MDDYLNVCYQELFPLLRVINFHLNKQVQVDYPNADRLFNLTWEKTIRERDDLNFASSYAASSNSTTSTLNEYTNNNNNASSSNGSVAGGAAADFICSVCGDKATGD